ncbi:dihydroxyacetone kinase family protein [Streptomyces sp. NPDC048436]|uniref:dihydroxyacetone kinase family protein n=1 Tax=Streptomyces sp. NPDC048436 TaxID=3365550 RepID=UPI003713C3B6
MTLLVNDARAFAREALAGFSAAHADLVRPVYGGVVRASSTPAGHAAVVLGGGSGHYPAFAGWVGPGLAHGAACGEVFASPSASQIASVARAAENGGGVLFGFGNYAGDVLHFGQAAERLRAEGIEARVLTVTDDIASHPDTAQRRGIAGDLTVFKILCAAAEQGLGLDEVERVGRKANAATRTLGIAFGGCTLPGAPRPLFTVAAGQMAFGLGIHGEPGLTEGELASADVVADRLLAGVLDDFGADPGGGSSGATERAAVLLNGLGATKYEELFVVYRRIAERLAAAGIEAVAPEVGEHVTSLDMAGLSLTLTFLDDELDALWRAPALAPAFRRGALTAPPPRTDDLTAPRAPEIVPGSEASQQAAAHIARALHTVRRTVAAHEEHLGALDAVAGDGDHGIGMRRGTDAAAEAADRALKAGAGAKTLLVRAGEAWSDGAGGTSGALWGAALTAAGATLGDAAPVTYEQLVRAVREAVDAVVRLGGARPGDKTLVDAALPFADRIADDGWAEAATAATRAADDTARIPARKGRARTHGDRSLGTPDPGAVSFALIVTALAPRPAPTKDVPDE